MIQGPLLIGIRPYAFVRAISTVYSEVRKKGSTQATPVLSHALLLLQYSMSNDTLRRIL